MSNARATLLIGFAMGLGTIGACSASQGRSAADGSGGGPTSSHAATSGSLATSTADATGSGGATVGSTSSAGGGPMGACDPSKSDLAGCTCPTTNATRPCYPANIDPNTRGVGACKDGSQTCVSSGEVGGIWGNCTGATTPVAEQCDDGIDNSCDGTTDCNDPGCAVNPACSGGCSNGQTRPCYDGPPGTEGVGTCKGGTQVCMNGMWPANCPGEVLPGVEVCTDALDHDCNFLPGCLDFFSCLLAPNCQPMCGTDPGCVCPVGMGDSATCPDGDVGVTLPGSPTMGAVTECCPCTANDCANPGCCDEQVCAGNPLCNGLTCVPLPPACNGQVSFDCDDFPEDCDEPCCKCTQCAP